MHMHMHTYIHIHGQRNRQRGAELGQGGRDGRRETGDSETEGDRAVGPEAAPTGQRKEVRLGTEPSIQMSPPGL